MKTNELHAQISTLVDAHDNWIYDRHVIEIMRDPTRTEEEKLAEWDGFAKGYALAIALHSLVAAKSRANPMVAEYAIPSPRDIKQWSGTPAKIHTNRNSNNAK